MRRLKIPRVMSTQHPDNVNIPFFARDSALGGEDEITEAYYAFAHLGIDEQMWDYEGKEVDIFVVKKLLTRYGDFFRKNILGKDVFITYRVPNPTIEKTEGKVLIETLESIPRSSDVAQIFYGDENIVPIFEVILPMTTSAQEINRVYYYYKKYVAGVQEYEFYPGDVKIKDWVGEFKPEEIEVIPLIENKESMLISDKIVEEYLKDKNFEYIRVFLARSDPALNYGLVSAVLLNKIALIKLWELSEKISVEIYPIIGVGSPPFRGNFKPTNIENCLSGYPSVQTFTVQSAFKYDYPPDVIRNAISEIKSRKRGKPIYFEFDRALQIIEKFTEEYTKQIEHLSNLINSIAKFVPDRRKRKLHIGLFGYSRNMGKIKLPRAIRFTASLYSIGLPPEIIGIITLSDKDIELISDVNKYFIEDMKDATKFLNEESLHLLLPRTSNIYKKKLYDMGLLDNINPEYTQLAKIFLEKLKSGDFSNLIDLVLEMGCIRGFLG